MLEFKFDTQLLIEGQNLSEDEIDAYISQNFAATACWRWATRS